MKFLMFNLVVGAALIFLFTSNKSDFQSVAETTHATVQDLKETAKNIVNQSPTVKTRKVRAPVWPELQAEEDEISVAVVPDDLTRLADEMDKASTEEEALSPAVAKRREQIFQTETSAEIFTFERREDRQEKLRSLSEEMELFSAEITGR